MKLTNQEAYGVIAVLHLAEVGTRKSAKQISQDTRIDKTQFLAKTLQTLSNRGILNGEQGSKGGFKIGCDLNKTTVLDVVEAVGGKIAPFDPGKKCPFKGILKDIDIDVQEAFTRSLASIVGGEG